MFEHKIRLVSEGLARTIGRRKFMAQMGSAVFGGMAAIAAGHTLSGRVEGATMSPKQLMAPTIQCAPPGPYCSTNGTATDGCNGAHCFQHLYNGQTLQCVTYYTFYAVGCWTTASGGGYWTCCDCRCGTDANPQMTTCGCAQFTDSTTARPD